MELRLTPAHLGAAALAALCIAPALASPLPAEDFAKIPTIQSVTMSADGKQLVAIVAAPGSNNSDTALANWNLDNLGAGPVAITPSGDRMKFIAASALKAGRNLVIGRQEWTGKLGGCGEGNSTGATKTFLTKAYLTDATQTKFDEAFANNTRTLGVSPETLRCLELAGTASLVHGLPLDADRVIISQLNEATLQANYYRFNLRTGQTELLFKGSSRTSPGLFHPRTGEVLTQTQVESAGSDDFEQRIMIKNSAGQFEVHAPP